MSRARRDGHASRTVQLSLLRLDGARLTTDTDYLYCPICRVHVPCRRVPTGGWEVDCPGCDGECAFCNCYLQRFCFGNRELFPPFDRREEEER